MAKAERVLYRCVYPECEYSNLNPSRDTAKKMELMFHSFPKNEIFCNKWILAIGNPDFKVRPTSKVCSNHFVEESYEHMSSVVVDMVKSPRRLLKKDAIPNYVKSRDSIVEDYEPPTKRAKSLDSVLMELKPLSQDFGVQSVLKVPVRSKGIQVLPTAVTMSTQTVVTQRRTIGCQTSLLTCEKDIQTSDIDLVGNMLTSCDEYDYDEEEDEEDSEDDSGAQRDPLDTSFAPSERMEDEINISRQFKEGLDNLKDKKFIVFESALLQLFVYCFQCFSKCSSVNTSTKGSMLTIYTVCPNGHKFNWNSQQLIGRKPAFNFLAAAAILFSGLNPGKALRMFKFSGVQLFSTSTFYHIQKAYLFRAINNVWTSEQTSLLDLLKGQPIELGGDARSDSPGHSAKYGSYCFLENKLKKFIHLVLIQSNQVKNSVAMELEGLKQGLKYLIDKGMSIYCIVTDRHIQIRKFLRENYPTIHHYFDVWHFVKSIKSKIFAACGKKKSMDVLLSWSKSIQNHIYWLASSSAGNTSLMRAKWASILRHIVNLHKDHGEPFDACTHEELEENREKDWLNPNSPACEAIHRIVTKQAKDVEQLSPSCQTSAVEAYHAVVIHFAPKHTHYSFNGMRARLILAALHYNENSTKLQASTVKGKRRWNIIFPKYKKGEYSIRPIMAASTYNYITDIMENVLELAKQPYESAYEFTLAEFGHSPEALCAKYNHPLKEDALKSYETNHRFQKTLI